MAEDRTQIINLLRERGPLVQNEIKRALGGDTLIFGAILSELKSRGLVEMTQVKKGGSSFYYVPELREQVAQLIEFLNPKDQVTVRRLQEQKVLNEANEELFTRVSFRNIPDFAKPFMMQTPQGEYRFWRYYLVGEQEARTIVAQNFQKPASPASPPVTPAPVPEEIPLAEKPSLQEEPASGMLAVKEQVVSASTPENKSQKPVEKQPEESIEKPLEKVVEKQPEKQAVEKQAASPLQLSKKDTQQHLIITPNLETTPFYETLITYFTDNEISLHAEEQLTKDREYSFIVTIPTAVGPLRMYAHGRNKKKFNEGDVAPALLKSKNLDLPCLFLHTGEFTKKSLQIIKKEYKGIILKEVKV
jgi:hypothetical protein